MKVGSKQYLKLKLLGRGGSSRVYEVLDKDSLQVRAVKVVNLENVDEDTLNSYKNEISILEKLKDCDRVIHLYDHEVMGNKLVLVMEKGNLDFTAILNEARTKGCPIPFFTIQHYWAGMLQAVQQIHNHGIIHSDLKPANFLLVDGTVKLIDFGISSSIQNDMTSVIKDSQAGTYNYMSPESLLDIHSGPIINNLGGGGRPTIKIRVKSDVWSLGCILYNLVYGRTPFQHITNPLQKLAAISNANTRIDFPDNKNKHLLDVMRLCLQYDPQKRPSMEELLDHPLLKG